MNGYIDSQAGRQTDRELNGGLLSCPMIPALNWKD